MTVALYIKPSPQSCSLIRRLYRWGIRQGNVALNENVQGRSWESVYRYLLTFSEGMVHFMIDGTESAFEASITDGYDWVGISPKDLRRLVERFEELENSREEAA